MANEEPVQRWRFRREARTTHSEQWAIETEQYSLGRVDLHFTPSVTHATLALHVSVPEEDIEELIATIDERLVLSADPDREDFLVTVWRGESYGTFSEDMADEDDDGSEDDPSEDGDSGDDATDDSSG